MTIDQSVIDDPTSPQTTTARVTIVIESVTPDEYLHHGHGAEDPGATIDALRSQNEDEALEIILMVNGSSDELKERFEHLDDVSVISSDATSYYEMKNAGAQVATTEFVALLDADCVPTPGWLKAVLTAFDEGADVVAGKSRYLGPGLWSRVMNYFDFGSVEELPDGSGSQFHLNNVAMRRHVFQNHPLDTRLRRSGGCYMACLQMRAGGCTIRYMPTMRVIHGNDYKVKRGFDKRLRNGHDAATLRFVDDDHLLPHQGINRLGLLATPLIVAARIKRDWFRLFRNRSDLDYSDAMVLLVCAVAVPMRLVEGVAFAISSVRPDIIGKHWG